MRKCAVLFMLVGMLALAACGGGGSGGNGGSGGGAATITMGGFNFSGNTSVSIKAGQSVTFADPSSGGGIHDLVTGSNGTFTAAAGAPAAFSSNDGTTFNPGDSQTITFATAGTYNITCKIHPSMEATVTVTP